MSDYDSSLPIRTQNNGDAVVEICDGTITSQKLAIDASGKITSKLDDAAGNGITSQTNGAQQALDVMNQANGPVSPGTAAAFSELIGGQYNVTLPTLTDTQQAAVQVDSRGRLLVSASNFPSTLDTNYGVVGANTLRTASEIGNATGAANFNYGAINAQSLQTAAQLGNATGAVDYNFGAATAQTLRAAALVGNSTGLADFNYGVIGAQSLRTASQIGNATGAADFNNGTTGAQTLRVAANLAVGGANVTASNPVPVIIESSPGSHINDFKDASSIAAGASDNHDYTVTAGKTLHLNQVESSGSGKAKMEIQIETGVATGVFTSKFVQFNSTATPNMEIHLDDDISVAAGVRVRVIMSNRDNQAQDLYSTICGYEV